MSKAHKRYERGGKNLDSTQETIDISWEEIGKK